MSFLGNLETRWETTFDETKEKDEDKLKLIVQKIHRAS